MQSIQYHKILFMNVKIELTFLTSKSFFNLMSSTLHVERLRKEAVWIPDKQQTATMTAIFRNQPMVGG